MRMKEKMQSLQNEGTASLGSPKSLGKNGEKKSPSCTTKNHPEVLRRIMEKKTDKVIKATPLSLPKQPDDLSKILITK